jgi:hypothetical protein
MNFLLHISLLFISLFLLEKFQKAFAFPYEEYGNAGKVSERDAGNIGRAGENAFWKGHSSTSEV